MIHNPYLRFPRIEKTWNEPRRQKRGKVHRLDVYASMQVTLDDQKCHTVTSSTVFAFLAGRAFSSLSMQFVKNSTVKAQLAHIQIRPRYLACCCQATVERIFAMLTSNVKNLTTADLLCFFETTHASK